MPADSSIQTPVAAPESPRSQWPERPAAAPLPVPRPPPPPLPAPLEAAYGVFATDPAFAAHPPTREQVARAWAMANFQKLEGESPTHAELVATLKKIFPEFRGPKPPPPPPSPGKSW
jgi:hypothetical protein